MPNMSYCRFRNTLSDLIDCRDNWDKLDRADISDEDEIRARKRLLLVCKEIAEMES